MLALPRSVERTLISRNLDWASITVSYMRTGTAAVRYRPAHKKVLGE